MLTRGNEAAISHWPGARHGSSRMLGGRRPLSCDRLDVQTYGTVGLNTHSWATTVKSRETLLDLAYKHSHLHTFVCTDSLMVDGDDEDADAGRTPTASR